MASVFIIGDNQITRSGLRRILESETSIRVLGEASIKRTSADSILDYGPNLVLIDLDPQAADPLGLISALLEAPGGTALLILSDLADHELARKALAMGASGIVLKTQPPSVLIAAIGEFCSAYRDESLPTSGTLKNHRNTIGRLSTKQPDDAKHWSKISTLTAREREIIWLVGLGLKNKDIAQRLSISDITVRHHLTSIFCKLEVSDRQKLLILAHRYGLAELKLH
jgi:DNA-binding NarL/FixJ family response regulator